MRQREPVTFVPAADLWLVTSHEHCRAVLRDERFSASRGQLLRQRRDPLPTSMLTTDAAEHVRLRAGVTDAFAPRALGRCRGWIREIVRDRVRRFLSALESGADADLVADFSRPLAVAVLGRFLGMPDDESAEFGGWSRAVAVNLDPFADGSSFDGASRQMHRMLWRFAEHLHARSADPRDDALTVIARSHAAGMISAAEALSTVGLLVVGGVEPMSDAIANSAAALLESRVVRPHDSVSVRTAVDELLRFDSPIQFTARRATEDVVLGARRIAAGDKVVVLLGAANRDPERFANPDRVVVNRRPNPHLTFGSGAHVCLGAPLVRLVAELICQALPHPVPALVAGRAPAVRSLAAVPRGYITLPVRQLADHP
jgi:cytochrome P450